VRVELFFDTTATGNSPPPRYCLRSSSQPLYSPLRSPRRPRRNNLVTETDTGASSSTSSTMTGPQVLSPRYVI
jgi:hypothetical protein